MNCVSPNKIEHPHDEDVLMSVPCGKCIACLVSKRNAWSFRLTQEYKASQSAMFVTLTYDQKHAPSDGQLCKRHLQLFMKRLRKKDESKRIRYYAVGEYGSQTGRPHYHILLFNSNEVDVRASWMDASGRPVGIVHVGQVTEASVAYCTKYIVQPDVVPIGYVRPFALMSRAYGIGGNYLTDEMVQWHRDGDRIYTQSYGVKGTLPRFYKDKIWPKKVRFESRKVGRFTVLHRKPDLADRTRISLLAMTHSLEQQRKEMDYYHDTYGVRAVQVKRDFEAALLNRVKEKVAFSQTF